MRKKTKSKGRNEASKEDDLDKDPTFEPSSEQEVLKKKKTKSNGHDLYSDEHFTSMLTMKKRPTGPWREQLLVHLPGDISSYLLKVAAQPDDDIPMIKSIDSFRSNFKKWISAKELKNIRDIVIGSGVDAEALESKFPCLAV